MPVDMMVVVDGGMMWMSPRGMMSMIIWAVESAVMMVIRPSPASPCPIVSSPIARPAEAPAPAAPTPAPVQARAIPPPVVCEAAIIIVVVQGVGPCRDEICRAVPIDVDVPIAGVTHRLKERGVIVYGDERTMEFNDSLGIALVRFGTIEATDPIAVFGVVSTHLSHLNRRRHLQCLALAVCRAGIGVILLDA